MHVFFIEFAEHKEYIFGVFLKMSLCAEISVANLEQSSANSEHRHHYHSL